MPTAIQAASGKAEEEAAIRRSHRRRRQCLLAPAAPGQAGSASGRRGRRRRPTRDPLEVARGAAPGGVVGGPASGRSATTTGGIRTMKRSKAYRRVVELVDRQRVYSPLEAASLAK